MKKETNVDLLICQSLVRSYCIDENRNHLHCGVQSLDNT